MKDTKHTPGPWHFDGRLWEEDSEVNSWSGDISANHLTARVYGRSKSECEANADYVVRAVNTFDQAREALDNIVGKGAQLGEYCDPSEHDESGPCIFCTARAVLAEMEKEGS